MLGGAVRERSPSQSAPRRWRFRPGWPATLATALLLPLLIALGQWQLGRAEAKDARRAELAARSQVPPWHLGGGAPLPPAEVLAYRPVEAAGEYDAAHQMLLDNQVHDGQAGYRVITPLTLAGGDRPQQILVDRGWVPAPAERSHAPQVPVPQGPVLARGTAMPPAKAAFLLAPEEPGLVNGHWRGVWQYLTPERYAAARQAANAAPAVDVAPVVLPVVLQLAAPDSAAPGHGGESSGESGGVAPASRTAPQLQPLPLAPLPPDDGAARNRAYAGQWFAFAATLAALYIGLNLRRRP